MIIKECSGYELEKEKPNTSEDFFNRSEVVFVDDGEEKTFHLLYIRYFDELFQEFVPFEADPLFSVSGKEVYFKDIAGLVCLLKNPGFRNRKRVYINTKKEFADYFKGIDYHKLKEIFEGIDKGGYQLKSPVEFMSQP